MNGKCILSLTNYHNPMNNNPHCGKQPYARYTISFQNEGNARKERMNQRIMKQFQDAIKCHKAGKPVPFDELPCPPGKMVSSPLLCSPHLPPPIFSFVFFTGFYGMKVRAVFIY